MMAMDLFTKARLKITFLYFILGIIILVVAGYFIYADLTTIIKNTLQIVGELLNGTIAPNQGTAANVIAETINAQVRQMDLAVGIWLILAMVFSAYLLAGITLRPVKRAMERQKRFMSNISHELRTPLSVMMTNSEAALLGVEGLSQSEMSDVVTSNLEELDRMAKIIEFLLNFSNIENRLTRLAFTAVDVVEVAKRTVGLVQRFADEKNITVTLAGEDTATVSGNVTAIEEMVLNLVKNAITYTPHNGAVTLSVVKKFGAVTLSVKDTGVGISKKDIPNIFEAFYRGDNVVSVKKSGESVGLGLAIVREIATFHGATIAVHSEVGEGTTITVHFPGRFSRWFALP
jgi:signal transduction histidine kinase